MSSSFYYSGTNEVLVDFTNSSDTVGLQNMYSSLKAALQASHADCLFNDTLKAILICNSGSLYTCITMALGLGFGFFPTDDEIGTLESSFSSLTTFTSLFSKVSQVYGQTDVCLLGSKASSPEDPDTKVVVNSCYGYDYQHHVKVNRNTNQVSVNGETITLKQGSTWLTDFATSGLLGSCYSNKQSLWTVAYRGNSINEPDKSKSRRSTKFILPRYCYGRVNFSVMSKSNGSWAIYLHQTRPYKKRVGLSYEFDEHADWKRFGAVSVMFYDSVSNTMGWIMPQGPSPIGNRRNSNRNNYSWSVLSLIHYTTVSNEPNIYSINSANDASWRNKLLIDTKKGQMNTLALDYPIFNSETSSFNVSPLKIFIKGKYSFPGNHQVINIKEIAIDKDIISHGYFACTVNTYVENRGSIVITPQMSMFRSYDTYNGSPNDFVRTKSDSTKWEWGGNGMIHRIE